MLGHCGSLAQLNLKCKEGLGLLDSAVTAARVSHGPPIPDSTQQRTTSLHEF